MGIPGPHRRFFDVGPERGLVELWVLHGQALAELRRQTFQADAWYFDGFNPAENPSLWTAELMAECARLMAPGSLGGTFSVAAAVRQAMVAAGLVHENALALVASATACVSISQELPKHAPACPHRAYTSSAAVWRGQRPAMQPGKEALMRDSLTSKTLA